MSTVSISTLAGPSNGTDPAAPQADADTRAFQLPDALQAGGHLPRDQVRRRGAVETRSHGPPAGVPASLNHAATEATRHAPRTSCRISGFVRRRTVHFCRAKLTLLASSPLADRPLPIPQQIPSPVGQLLRLRLLLPGRGPPLRQDRISVRDHPGKRFGVFDGI